MWFLLCFLCFLRFFSLLLQSGGYWGEEKTPSDRCPGGQDKGFALKLSWPNTAEHRMMKLKKNLKKKVLFTRISITAS